jgi:hypothetical protein
LGASVLNNTCLTGRQNTTQTTIQPRHEWMPTGARLTCRQIHCNITTLPCGRRFPDRVVRASTHGMEQPQWRLPTASLCPKLPT